MEPKNDSFQCDWIFNQGIDQSRCFMNIVVDQLCISAEKFNEQNVHTVLDWGCAMGSGTDVLVDFFIDLKVPASIKGLDISWNAINAAQQIYKNIPFICDDHISDNYDMIVTSNCLEHFENPQDFMKDHMAHTNKYYAVLVPYNDNFTVGHLYAFTEVDFPKILNGFKRIYLSIVPPCSHWTEEQIFVLYERI